MKRKKIALFHPWIKSRGGSEKSVLEILKSRKYDVELYTWIYEESKTFEEFKKFKINVLAPKILRKVSRTYLLKSLFLPISLFSKIPLKKYEYFLISTSGVAEFITFRNYKPKKTYGYIYTPLRAASKDIVNWNFQNRYKNFLSRFFYLIAVKFYKILEQIAWKRIDKAIFISELSLERARIKGLLKNKKTEIIYPPVNVEKFNKLKTNEGNYFLYVSRFNKPKRQDVLLKSWKIFSKNHPQYKLVLAGNIENEKYFNEVKKLANETKNVEIKTNLNEIEIMNLYANCLAVVFVPFIEDFGIVPFEALATGKSLIAVDRGGYVQLINKNKQFHKIKEVPSEEEMINEINIGLEKFLKSKVVPKKINLEEVSSTNFIKKLEEIFIK